MGAFLGPDQCRNDVISGTEARQADVRFGSKADTVTSPRHVRFTPDNGRWAVQVRCPQGANSRHTDSRAKAQLVSGLRPLHSRQGFAWTFAGAVLTSRPSR